MTSNELFYQWMKFYMLHQTYIKTKQIWQKLERTIETIANGTNMMKSAFDKEKE